MNRKQRDQNRANARRLEDNAVICPNCGERGKHYVVMPGGFTLQHILDGRAPEGFWTCRELYGPDGRRIAKEPRP